MSKIDILLAYPKTTRDSPVKLLPLSILFPGAMFEKQGLKVEYFDERFDSEEMLVDLVKRSKEIGVSAFTGYQTGQAARILKLAKKVNPEIIAGVGGHHARLLPEEVLAEPFVDKVWTNRVYGEDLFPYNQRTKVHFERTDMQYFTSRGCPFGCRFCALSSPWEPKNIKDLDRELKIIHQDIGFKEISFSDPNIAHGVYKESGKIMKLDRVERIRQIGKIMRDIEVKWDSNIRANYITAELVETLAEANCFSLEVGCESGNDFFLKNVIRKGEGIAEIKNAAKLFCGSGISVMYSFMAHMPRETRVMLNDTLDMIDWLVDNDPNARVSIFNYAPYPGTPMYQDAVDGVEGYPKFIPPTTMEDWGNLGLMISPLYWITGLCFRQDNSRKNFPGEDWQLIEPYIKLAQKKWREREIDDFPTKEVETLIARQVEKHRNDIKSIN
ncbi:MAG: Radical SAM domain protein [Parcubacteria group bacterium GW2011_GWC2_42_12]|nr:MAG: Radical SAM domain protein [Parcubacteria group bacterium GW2011_GWC2_42_12]